MICRHLREKKHRADRRGRRGEVRHPADRAREGLRAKKGWTVSEDHIYSDDGICGAEFVKRPGLHAPDECPQAEAAVSGARDVRGIPPGPRADPDRLRPAANHRRRGAGLLLPQRTRSASSARRWTRSWARSRIRRRDGTGKGEPAHPRRDAAQGEGAVTSPAVGVFGYDNHGRVRRRTRSRGERKRFHVVRRINEPEAADGPHYL